jgi:hypothetical protein
VATSWVGIPFIRTDPQVCNLNGPPNKTTTPNFTHYKPPYYYHSKPTNPYPASATMSALIIGSLITVAAFRGTLFPSSSSSSFSLTVTATAFQFPLGHPLSRIAAATFSRTSSSSSVRPPTIQLFSSSSSSSSSSSPADAFTKRTADNDNNIADTFKSYLYNPIERDEHYQGNIAQYLLDLHNEVSDRRRNSSHQLNSPP